MSHASNFVAFKLSEQLFQGTPRGTRLLTTIGIVVRSWLWSAAEFGSYS